MRIVKACAFFIGLSFVTACGDEGDVRENNGNSQELTINFLSPSSPLEPASGNSYEIEVSFTGTSADATYDVFYEQNSCDSYSEDNVIVDDRSVSNTTVNWDISGLAPGVYCVWGRVSDGNKSDSISGGSIQI